MAYTGQKHAYPPVWKGIVSPVKTYFSTYISNYIPSMKRINTQGYYQQETTPEYVFLTLRTNHSWECIWLQFGNHLLPTPGNVLDWNDLTIYFPPLGMYLVTIIVWPFTLYFWASAFVMQAVWITCVQYGWEYNWFDWNRVKGPLCVLRWKLLMKDRVFLYIQRSFEEKFVKNNICS